MYLSESIGYQFRQRRRLGSCQLSGFALLGAALTIVEHPASIALDYINTLYALNLSPYLWAAAFFVCGYLLAWHRRANGLRMFLLTAPILLYTCVQWIYFFTVSAAASTPAYLTLMLFICLQVTNARQEVWAEWAAEIHG